MTPLRVVIAEDQPMVRAGFRALLDSRDEIEVVGEAATGAEALDQVQLVIIAYQTGIVGHSNTPKRLGAPPYHRI